MKRHPVIPVEANARNLELAREALKSCVTRLRNAENRTSMRAADAARCKQLREWLASYDGDIAELEVAANAHMAAMRAKRGAA